MDLPHFIVTPFEAVVGLIVDLIRHFNSRDVAFLVAFAIILGSTAVWAALLRPAHRTFVRALKGAARIIRLAEADDKLSAEDRLTVVDDALRRNAAIAQAWRPYRGALRPDPRNEGSFVNPVDPAGWFSPDRLSGHGYEKWISTMAGVCLTLGLLFTFVGLSAALFKVGDAGADTSALRDAISEILRISSAKFITSMAGIVAYIIWTIVARWYSSTQTKLACKVASAIQALSSPLTPEALLLDQLEEARAQTTRWKTLSDDMAVAFDSSLNRVLGERLDRLPAAVGEILQPALERTVQPVVDAIQGMGGSIGQGNQSALERMIGDLKSEVATSAGNEMRLLATSMKDAADQLAAAKTGIGEGGTEFGQVLARASAEMASSSERMARAMELRAGEIDGRMASIENALSSGAERFHGMGLDMSRQLSEGLVAALKNVAAASSEGAAVAREQVQAALAPVLSEMATLMRDLRETAREGGGALIQGGRTAAADLGTALSRAGEEMTEASRRATEILVDAVGRSTSRMSEGVEDSVAGYRRATDELAARLTSVESGFANLEGAVGRNVSQLGEAGSALTVAGRTFNVASEQLRLATVPVLSAVQTVEGAVQGSRETMRAMQETGAAMRDSASAMTSSAQASVQAFGSYEKRFAGVDESLGRTVATMRDGIVQLGERVADVVQQYDDHLGRAVGSLKSGVEDLAEAIEDLGERRPRAA